MTVKELKERLSKFDDSERVFIEICNMDHEIGYIDADIEDLVYETEIVGEVGEPLLRGITLISHQEDERKLDLCPHCKGLFRRPMVKGASECPMCGCEIKREEEL